jgi:DNA-directed RNA polymerase specialized sigma24 family protein
VERRDPLEPQAGNLLVDPVLLPYLRATDESSSQRLAEQLVLVQAEPIIQGIIRYKLPMSLDHATWNGDNQDAEDVRSEAILELLAWLRKFKADPENSAVRNFRGFVAAVAYRACASYLRKKHPQRLSLKNKLYYALTHSRDFALWKSRDDEWICGFAAWSDHTVQGATNRLQLLRENPHAFEQAALPRGDLRQMSPAELVAAIFTWVGTPIRLNDLVSVVAELWGIRDQIPEPRTREEDSGTPRERTAMSPMNITTEVEQRVYLQRIWVEIGELPLKQRCALLLNLTESPGHGVIALLPVTGIASVRQIAQTLGMTDQQLTEIWNALPLDDAAIAAHLGVTRQQVINLRKSARERLVRRMKVSERDRELVLSSARP